jgi:hypothetical protein
MFLGCMWLLERRTDGWLVFPLRVHIAYSNTSNPLIDWFSVERRRYQIWAFGGRWSTGVVTIVERKGIDEAKIMCYWYVERYKRRWLVTLMSYLHRYAFLVVCGADTYI